MSHMELKVTPCKHKRNGREERGSNPGPLHQENEMISLRHCLKQKGPGQP
ncbi:hypothetical protein AAFF_G00303970 [Aldrovandia affinis]|uniref:Uncharacterized protein n=1 Tax=Aldrovandia affinis TaxID=143900 RepID=A0AAD7WQY7_9TELE|nr:hypothetical protein AAFF_G00303970 [Aldrovandia affinis]